MGPSLSLLELDTGTEGSHPGPTLRSTPLCHWPIATGHPGAGAASDSFAGVALGMEKAQKQIMGFPASSPNPISSFLSPLGVIILYFSPRKHPMTSSDSVAVAALLLMPAPRGLAVRAQPPAAPS